MPKLVCTDLDRTLLPNGEQPESPGARETFAKLVTGAQAKLAYVSGRDLGLVMEAIDQYQLPIPDFAVTDVGSMIYVRHGEAFKPLDSWQHYLSDQWQGHDSADLAAKLGSFEQLTLQDAARQKPFKLSYQITPASALSRAVSEVERRLSPLAWPVNLVASVDETADEGLIDLLPANAGKRAAIDFLANELELESDEVFFSGDSGNDLDVLVSPYPSVLVKNAIEEVVLQAVTQSKMKGVDEKLWVAQGDETLGLNGNYSAGIVEGLLYFYPQLRRWLTVEQDER